MTSHVGMTPLPPAVPAGERAFLVARTGEEVVIREVQPGSSLVEWTRSVAWERARQLAQPAKSSTDPRRKHAAPTYFVALDGSRTKVADAPVPEQKPKVAKAKVPAVPAGTHAATRPGGRTHHPHPVPTSDFPWE